jgi:hypothetical protein
VSEIAAEVPSAEETCRPGVLSLGDDQIFAVGDTSDSDRVMSVSVQPDRGEGNRPATDAGITVGSTFDELLAACPDAEPYESTNGHPSYRLSDGTGYIHFVGGDQPSVHTIEVSHTDRELKEFCG